MTSLERPMVGVTEGSVHQVQWRSAAMLESSGTHRLSTIDEIQAELRRLDMNRQEAIRNETTRKRNNFMVVMSPEQAGIETMTSHDVLGEPVKGHQKPSHPQKPQASENTNFAPAKPSSPIVAPIVK